LNQLQPPGCQSRNYTVALAKLLHQSVALANKKKKKTKKRCLLPSFILFVFSLYTSWARHAGQLIWSEAGREEVLAASQQKAAGRQAGRPGRNTSFLQVMHAERPAVVWQQPGKQGPRFRH